MLVSIESVLMQVGVLWGATQTHTLQALQGLCQLCRPIEAHLLATIVPTPQVLEHYQDLCQLYRYKGWVVFRGGGL